VLVRDAKGTLLAKEALTKLFVNAELRLALNVEASIIQENLVKQLSMLLIKNMPMKITSIPVLIADVGSKNLTVVIISLARKCAFYCLSFKNLEYAHMNGAGFVESNILQLIIRFPIQMLAQHSRKVLLSITLFNPLL